MGREPCFPQSHSCVLLGLEILAYSVSFSSIGSLFKQAKYWNLRKPIIPFAQQNHYGLCRQASGKADPWDVGGLGCQPR